MDPQQRIDELEQAFGPLGDPDNPLGERALLAADHRGEVLTEGEKTLDAAGFNAESVPGALGGRLTRMDVLGRMLRPVFRRDASLGFGYGLNCFFAATPVWTAGSAAQRRTVARLLLDGERVAVARHEVTHGNAFVRDEFTARAVDGGFVLQGSKTVIANGARAAGLVVFAGTGSPGTPAGRCHSVFLLDRSELPADRLVGLGRDPTSGLRSTEFSGLEALDCPVPGDALVGAVGDGYEISLRSSLLIRGLIPSIVLAGADTALRTVARFAVRRREDGRSSLDVRHVRDVLTGAFLDLLISDCLALVATRAVHLLPRHASAYAAAGAYLAPKMIAESMDALSSVLGKAQFTDSSASAMFRKQLRDLPVTSLGHAGSAGRQISVLPQLPVFARNSWFAGPEPPGALFSLDGDLPPLDPAALALLGDSDPLAATLVFCTARQGSAFSSATRSLVEALTGELEELRNFYREVSPDDRRTLSGPHSLGLTDRYAMVLSAAAVIGVWQQARAQGPSHGPTGSFLSDPAWLDAALYRLAGRLGLTRPGQQTASEQRVLAELLARLHGGRAYDLYGMQLAE
ncbi:acyl-CoA dehydrogenase [Streptomyces sp. ACA25]|uniref:acyl-CoA dehydrogenase n=1 Tax=Streptomyces sp. ACA25 TaxID=3022596 RepID=UPI00230720C0|nr:acyl-CoA dehydrogenase [Streptomyces sp. ACA25]MDB1089569.1 acyl-CoA dehydrogenase [Streptomyces sp. ACA25]